VAAQEAGKFKGEIVPVSVPGRKGPTVVDTDEGPRKDTTVETLAKLRPAFPGKDGKTDELTVTAANASSLNDGGAAVVVTSERTARELGVPAPVPILGIGQSQASYEVHLRPDLTETCAGVAASQAFAQAGLNPADIRVAQLYDCFTITVLLTLEAYGICAKGQAAAFARDGQLEIGGRLALNTSGGLLSETGMPGLQLVMEGVRQMRGTSVNQVKDAATCVVSNQGGIMTTHSTLILGQ
jgi:acetyl-CoA acetyltransferase